MAKSFFGLSASVLALGFGSQVQSATLTLYDEAVFYDGYAGLVDEPVPSGIQRLRNDLFTRKLTGQDLAQISGTLGMTVVIGALCDNYDRIGSVALAMVLKGEEGYDPNEVERIELSRFITPFMDKNRQPDQVPYHFNLNHIVPILKDAKLLSLYDFWLELEVFGVPYAANSQVDGCDGRNDVFRGSVIFEGDNSSAPVEFDMLIPLAYRIPFNNYQEGATDAIGTTRKTIPFTLDAPMANTQLVLISSNHGANYGGEEYIRRYHYVSVDGENVLTYRPGRLSCEPFRVYNTQANGIYSYYPRTPEEWQSFSNWCPGDKIDTRIIELGAMQAGEHEFVIDVPEAEFAGGSGNFPLSVYVQGQSF